MGFKVAEFKRRKLRARVALCGASGGGKTLSALLLASGLSDGDGMVVCINTEPEGPQQYAGRPGVPDPSRVKVIEMEPPFRPSVYVEAINFAVQTYKPVVIIIDSLSHAWAGKGGALEIVDDKKRTARNEFTVWGDVTKEQNSMVEAIVRAPCHVIACMRSKMEYVLETNDKGKQVPKKVGMAPIQREGIEYEFTVAFDLDSKTHTALTSKDRTGLYMGLEPFVIVPQVGADMAAWLDSGAADEPEAPAASPRLTLQGPALDAAVASVAKPPADDGRDKALTALKAAARQKGYPRVSDAIAANGGKVETPEVLAALPLVELVKLRDLIRNGKEAKPQSQIAPPDRTDAEVVAEETRAEQHAA
jgi:hypothetical protein